MGKSNRRGGKSERIETCGKNFKKERTRREICGNILTGAEKRYERARGSERYAYFHFRKKP